MEEPRDKGIWKRLAVGLALTGAMAWVCGWILPRWGVDVPWWVPVLAFGVIVVATVARYAGQKPDPDEEPEVAGRIGPEGMEERDG